MIITLTLLNLLPFVKQASIGWLLEWKSLYIEFTKVVTLDGALIGWPWINDTFSWVQPTSYAIFALKLVGLREHARIKEAEALLFDRMCPGADGILVITSSLIVQLIHRFQRLRSPYLLYKMFR